MNNADRILRIIYTEADLVQLAIWPAEGLLGPEKCQRVQEHFTQGYFWFESASDKPNQHCKEYRRRLIDSYLHCYPHNYSEDEVALLVETQVQRLSERRSVRSANAAHLFPYYANKLLLQKNDQLFVKFDNLLEWNGFVNKVDANIFVAAYDAIHHYMHQGSSRAEKPRRETTCSVKHTDSRLAHILSKGYADNHAHLNASGYSPEMNWYYFIRNSEYNETDNAKRLEALVRGTWMEKDAADQDRLVLAYRKIPVIRNFLLTLDKLRTGEIKANPDPMKEDQGPEQEGQAPKQEDQAPHGPTPKDLHQKLARLFFLQDDVSLHLFKELKEPRYAAECCALEIGKTRFEKPSEYFEFEQQFLQRMFTTLLRGQLSPVELYAFNVYLAALTQFKLCVTQDNTLMGFGKFARAEKSKDLLFSGLSETKEVLYESVFERCYRECGMRKAEFRIAPKKKKQLIKLIDQLDAANDKVHKRLVKSNPNLPKIEYRLIIHFIKDKAPCSKAYGEVRKHKTVAAAQKGFKQLERFFELGEDSFSYVRKIAALDTANYELNSRPENFGPLFRTFTYDITHRFDTGLTYHVGEDFPTLCNGLRAIDDAIEFLALQDGDRLGHATALGLDVDLYFKKKRGYITSSLQDHVDDLAWMWGMLRSIYPIRHDLLQYLEGEYHRFVRELFSLDDPGARIRRSTPPGRVEQPASLEDYLLAYALRGNDPELYTSDEDPLPRDFRWEGKRFRDERAKAADRSTEARRLYRHYHFNPRLKAKGDEVIVAAADRPYVESVALVQKALRDKVHDKMITIETNPSSNRKISHVEKFIELPFIRLNQHGLTLPSDELPSTDQDLPLTINTDDSAVFKTNLETEYAFIAAALAREGFEYEEIYGYVDYLRELSLAQSFVRGGVDA